MIIYDNTPARTGPFIAHFCEAPTLLALRYLTVTASSAVLLFSRRFREAYTRHPLIVRLQVESHLQCGSRGPRQLLQWRTAVGSPGPYSVAKTKEVT